MERQGIGFSRAMGGVGIGMRMPNKINYLNPASYTTQDSSSFIFDFGLAGNNTNYESSTAAFNINNASFSHLAISFPITRWMFASLGATPFTKVGFNTRQSDLNKENIGLVDQYFEGNGGLNRFYFGTGVKFGNLSVGINGYYLTGTLNYEQSYSFYGKREYFTTIVTKKYNVRNLYAGIGAQYTFKIGENSLVVLGATFDNKASLNGTYSNFSRSEYKPVIDTISFDEANESGIVIPSRLGFGASVNLNSKFIVGFDYTTQDWTQFKMHDNEKGLQQSNSINVGMQYTPNEKALRGYLNHVNFRVGGYFTQTNLMLKNQNINDYGATFGLGLPFRHTRSMFHIGYQIGQRGTLTSGLVKETYQNVFFNFTLYDIWFIKAKFD